MKRQGTSKRLILGLTGSFGSGKSTVARIFKSLGATVIDADRIAHQIIRPGSQIYKKIINIFGKDILKKNKAIDRDKLAQIVFNNKNLLKKLNQIMHPQIIRIIKDEIKTSKSKLIILDAPLLIEAGLNNLVDKLIVVRLDTRQQIKRLLGKLSLKKSEILKRLNVQIPLEDKVRLADFVIDNSGTMGETEQQVKEVWEKMSLSLAAEKKK